MRKQTITRKFLAVSAIAALSVGAVACDDDDDGNIDDPSDDIEQEFDEGVDDVEEGVDDLEDEIDEELDD
jgi:hypothetical protein